MKSLLVLVSVLFMHHAQANSSTISMSSFASGLTVHVNLDRSNEFTDKIIDALKKSPLVQEVVNPWVVPGTVFKGEGFKLDLQPISGNHVVTLQFDLMQTDIEQITLDRQFLRAVSTQGAFMNFHQALLQSESEHVLTRSNPGRINRIEGEAAILEKDLFFSGTHLLNCINAFRRLDVSICTFDLN